MTAEDVIAKLGSDLKFGLTQAEVDQRLAKYGTNELEKEEKESIWKKIKE
jgi:magnesium-transporting ATPase (P-type)